MLAILLSRVIHTKLTLLTQMTRREGSGENLFFVKGTFEHSEPSKNIGASIY